MNPRRRQIAQMNVVPYVDVMLVLLVIFMVTAPFIQTESIDLPRVSRANPVSPAPIQVTIRADRSVWLRDSRGAQDSQRMSAAQLTRYITEAQTRNAQLSVVIAGDGNVRYEEVLHVMDILQKAQVQNIGLLVQPAP